MPTPDNRPIPTDFDKDEADQYDRFFNSFGPTAFARERATMCSSNLGYNAQLLQSILYSLYGNDADSVSREQLLAWAAHMRERMQGSDLLILKHDLMNRTEHAWDEISDAELDALPPLPADTLFAFERPRYFNVISQHQAEITARFLSVLVPFDLQGLPFANAMSEGREEFRGYVAYVRLLDQELLYAEPTNHDRFEIRGSDNLPVDPRTVASEFARMRQAGQVWAPTMVNDLAGSLGGRPRGMGDLIRLALARAAEGKASNIPHNVRRAAKTAGVKHWYYPPVRTLELPVETGPAPQAAPGDPTGRTISWEFEVGSTWDWAPDEHGNLVWQPGHWRRYRDADGAEVKRIWIKRYTKGTGKPRKPEVDTVTVAREPEPPTE